MLPAMKSKPLEVVLDCFFKSSKQIPELSSAASESTDMLSGQAVNFVEKQTWLIN